MRFVLIDQLLAIERNSRALARKVYTTEEIKYVCALISEVPPSLMIESMAQTAGWLLSSSHNLELQTALLMIPEASFSHSVRPGETTFIIAEVRSLQGNLAVVESAIFVDQKAVAKATLMSGIESVSSDSPFLSKSDAFTNWRNGLEGRGWTPRTWQKLSGPAALQTDFDKIWNSLDRPIENDHE